MKSIRTLADRMLNHLVPRETTGACEWWYRCIRNQPCSSHNEYTQRVWSCASSCGASARRKAAPAPLRPGLKGAGPGRPTRGRRTTRRPPTTGRLPPAAKTRRGPP